MLPEHVDIVPIENLLSASLGVPQKETSVNIPQFGLLFGTRNFLMSRFSHKIRHRVEIPSNVENPTNMIVTGG